MSGLRDSFDVNVATPNIPGVIDQATANGMGDLRRGWTAGRVGNDIMPLHTAALEAQIAGDTEREKVIRAQIDALQKRQMIFSPRVGKLEDIHGVGDTIDYAAGQVGQGVASMLDPMAVSAGLSTVGRVAGAIPNPIAKVVGIGAQGAAVAAPYLMSRNQLQGEFIGDAQRDPELMGRTSPTQLRDMAGNYASLAAIPDSALPGIVGRQVSGLSRATSSVARKAAMGPATKALLEMGFEGGTEALQSEMSHQAQGMLNPNRDTSGDAMDNWNNFAGGALGSGPFAAAGAYSEAGHNRLGAGVDAVKEKAGEVVDLLGNKAQDAIDSETGQKVEATAKKWWKMGKKEVVDLGKTGTEKAKGVASSVRQYRDEEALLSEPLPTELTDPSRAAEAQKWFADQDAKIKPIIQRRLAEEDSPEAKELLNRMNTLQGMDALDAMDQARDWLKTNGKRPDLAAAAGEFAGNVAQYAGKGAAALAKGAVDVAGKFASGVKQGMGKKNLQAQNPAPSSEASYEGWLERRKANGVTASINAMNDLEASKTGPQPTDEIKQKQAQEASYRRAVMIADYLSRAAQKVSQNDNPGLAEYIRNTGYEINDLADSWSLGPKQKERPGQKAAQRQAPGLLNNLSNIADDLVASLGADYAMEALSHLQKLADPKAAPMFDLMREAVGENNTQQGRATRKAARQEAKAAIAQLLPRQHFSEIMADEGGMDELFHQLELMSRGHAEPGLRQHLDKELGHDTVNQMMTLVSGATVPPQGERQMTEPVDALEQKQALKKMSKSGQHSIYGFNGGLAPRAGTEYKDIFAVTKKMTKEELAAAELAGEDGVRRPQLFKTTTDDKGNVTGTDKFEKSGDNVLEHNLQAMRDKVGYKSDEDTQGYTVEPVSAHQLMQEHNVSDSKKLALYRDYLRMDAQKGDKEAGVKSTRIKMLLGRLMANQQKPPGPSSQWTEQQRQDWQKALKEAMDSGFDANNSSASMEQLDDHQAKLAIKEADEYFKNHHVVVAQSMTDNDEQKMSVAVAAKIVAEGKGGDDLVRKQADAAARNRDEGYADEIRSRANILYFPNGEKVDKKTGEKVPVFTPIKASSLVYWAKSTRDARGQTTNVDKDDSPSDAKLNRAYLQDLQQGIDAFIGDGHAKGYPFKINEAGQPEYFGDKENPVPPSLVLHSATYEEALTQPGFRLTNMSRIDVNSKSKVADPRRRASYQRQLQQEAAKDEPFTADPQEPVSVQRGGVYVPASDIQRRRAEELADRLYAEDPNTWQERYAAMAPMATGGAQFYIPFDRNTKAVDFKRPDGGKTTLKINDSGIAQHEALTDDDNATESEFSKGQNPKAVPDEMTAQKWFTDQVNAKYQPPTNALHGMSSMRYNAEKLLATTMKNPAAGDREAITMLRTALPLPQPPAQMLPRRQEDGSIKKEKVRSPNPNRGKRFDVYRIAPIVHLLSQDHEETSTGKFAPLTNMQYFMQAGADEGLINILRRGAATVLIYQLDGKTDNPDMSAEHALRLARVLLANEKATKKDAVTRLQNLLNAEGGAVTAAEMAVNWGDPAFLPEVVTPKVQPFQPTPPAQTLEKVVKNGGDGILSPEEVDAMDIPEPKKPGLPKNEPSGYDAEAVRRARNSLKQQGVLPLTEAEKEAARKARNAKAAQEVAAAGAPKGQTTPSGGVQVSESSASGYRERTAFNAASAGTTVALANNFDTAGERLTKTVAGGKYVGIDLDAAMADPKGAGEHLAQRMKVMGSTTLNVAGNGIYTLAKDGLTQEQVNKGVYDIIAAAHAVNPITKIVSGGQTGVDIAGAVAARALGIPAVITLPKGYVQRDAQGADKAMGKAAIEQQIERGAEALTVKRNAQVISLDERRKTKALEALQRITEESKTRALEIMNQLSDEDLDILMNDRFGSFEYPKMPSILKEYFDDWNSDYGPGESGLSSDRIHSTYEEYYQHIVDDSEFWEPAQVAMAKAMLGYGAGPKRNAQVAGAALASSRDLMRSLGFKGAPEQFARVAGKLLTHPDINPEQFIKDSAQALSHIMMMHDSANDIREAARTAMGIKGRALINQLMREEGVTYREAEREVYRRMTEEALNGILTGRNDAQKSFVAKVVEAAKDLISKIKEFAGKDSFTDVVRNHFNELVERSKTPEEIKEGYEKVDFQTAVDRDPQSARVLAHMSKNSNISVTGSIVLGHRGTIYRMGNNMLHDLDFIVKGPLKLAEAHLLAGFPGAVKIHDFAVTRSKIDSYFVPPDGTTAHVVKNEAGKPVQLEVIRDGEVVGKTWLENGVEKKSGEVGTLVDLFTNAKSGETSVGTIPFTVDGKNYNIHSSDPSSIFDAKLEMGRRKDSNDYINYVSKLGQKFNQQMGGGDFATAGEMAEARAWLEKVAPGVILNFVKEAGWSGEFIESKNTINISTTAAAGILGATYHEGLHKFFAQFVRSNPQLKSKFERLVNDPRILGRIRELLADYPEALEQLKDGEERLAYAFQFWKAGLLHIDNEHKTFFQKIAALFRRVLGTVRDSEHALAIFQAFDQGKLAEPSAAGKVIAAQLAKGSWTPAMRKKLDALSQGLAAGTWAAGNILKENEHSPTARLLGRIMHSNPGDEKDAGVPGYLNAKRAMGKRFSNRIFQTLEDMDRMDSKHVEAFLQAATPLEDIKIKSQRDAVAEIRATLDDFYKYLTDAGVRIGKVENYYPTIWSVDKLLKNREKFINTLVTKYAEQMDAPDPHKAATRIFDALVGRYGVDQQALSAERGEVVNQDGAPGTHQTAMREDGVLSPFFGGKEHRMLWWMDAADKEMYLEKNMVKTLSSYIHQGVRAAEYQRRFGEYGYKLEKMLQKIRVEINEASHKAYSKDQEEDRQKWAQRQLRDIHMSVGAMEGTLGKDISPNMRKFNSYMIAYQNLRLLPMMIFSSFVDPMAQVARGAPMSSAMETFMYGMRSVFRSWADLFRDMPPERQKDEWTKLAETIGAIEVAMFNHHVAEEYSSVYMSPKAKKINDTLFKLNGMEAWDRANRTMATKWAVNFIEQHRSLPDRNHSKRWLAELGLTPETIPVNADGKLIVTAGELAAVKNISMVQAQKEIAPIHDALLRWVEGAVITPDAAQRPSWSSDPNYASVFHLKQFAYSHQQTIMRRAVQEMNHGNLQPLSALAMFIPVKITSDIMKGLVQGAGTLPPYMQGRSAGDWFFAGMANSGLGGQGDILKSAGEDWASLGGPAFEQILDAARDDFGRTAIKAMPVHSMWEYMYTGGAGQPVAA